MTHAPGTKYVRGGNLSDSLGSSQARRHKRLRLVAGGVAVIIGIIGIQVGGYYFQANASGTSVTVQQQTTVVRNLTRVLASQDATGYAKFAAGLKAPAGTRYILSQPVTQVSTQALNKTVFNGKGSPKAFSLTLLYNDGSFLYSCNAASNTCIKGIVTAGTIVYGTESLTDTVDGVRSKF